MKLKQDFKHINGMWPKTAKFQNETQQMESWQTSLVIQRVILDPSMRLINCQRGADILQSEQQKQVNFLNRFRQK